MKAVHVNKAAKKSLDILPEYKAQDFLISAKEAEAGGDIEQAINNYERVIKSDTLNEFAYNRLMVLYRKEKDYKKEKALIDKGIKAFEKHYATQTKHDKTVTSISEKLNKAFGLVDKKGNQLYEPEPIAKWRKRLSVVEKRLK